MTWSSAEWSGGRRHSLGQGQPRRGEAAGAATVPCTRSRVHRDLPLGRPCGGSPPWNPHRSCHARFPYSCYILRATEKCPLGDFGFCRTAPRTTSCERRCSGFASRCRCLPLRPRREARFFSDPNSMPRNHFRRGRSLSECKLLDDAASDAIIEACGMDRRTLFRSWMFRCRDCRAPGNSAAHPVGRPLSSEEGVTRSETYGYCQDGRLRSWHRRRGSSPSP